MAVVLVAGLGLAACGDDADDGAATTDPAPDASAPEGADAPEDPTDEADDGSDQSSETEAELLGTVVVDGVQYEITELRNCDPLDDGTVERELELQGIGQHEGERVQIDVHIEQIAGQPLNEVSWAGPEGVFGGPEDAEVDLAQDGSFVTGSATLLDSLNQTDTISIGFNLAVPAETISCR